MDRRGLKKFLAGLGITGLLSVGTMPLSGAQAADGTDSEAAKSGTEAAAARDGSGNTTTGAQASPHDQGAAAPGKVKETPAEDAAAGKARKKPEIITCCGGAI